MSTYLRVRDQETSINLGSQPRVYPPVANLGKVPAEVFTKYTKVLEYLIHLGIVQHFSIISNIVNDLKIVDFEDALVVCATRYLDNLLL